MNASDLIGVWSLSSCRAESQDGQHFHPYGEEPQGKLIYTACGNMSVTLMSAHRARFASDDLSLASAAEIKPAFDSFDAYCGRWTLDPGGAWVEHKIEAGRIPNWIGISHRRYCRLLPDGGLALTTEPFTLSGSIWKVEVTW